MQRLRDATVTRFITQTADSMQEERRRPAASFRPNKQFFWQSDSVPHTCADNVDLILSQKRRRRVGRETVRLCSGGGCHFVSSPSNRPVSSQRALFGCCAGRCAAAGARAPRRPLLANVLLMTTHHR